MKTKHIKKQKKIKKSIQTPKKKIVKKVKKTIEKPIEITCLPLGKCKSCKKSIKDSDFKNDVEAMKAFAVNGLCKKCNNEEQPEESEEHEKTETIEIESCIDGHRHSIRSRIDETQEDIEDDDDQDNEIYD